MRHINELIVQAASSETIVPGFNVFGHEEALAIVRAAERANSPVLLSVNRGARRGMAVEHWGALLTSIVESAAVPVGVHLDHCTEIDVIQRALMCGFTSVMYDGSKLPLSENISIIGSVVQQARLLDVAVEGEVGTVPYDDLGEVGGDMTVPEEAKAICENGGLDWLAVSVGNVHRLTDRKVAIDFDVLTRIEEVCTVPLVIHGASGIREEDIQRLKRTRVGKMNIGTALRQVFGESLRREFMTNPDAFDRLSLFKEPVRRLEEKAYELICGLK
jgi:fructose-bisphosphate aldolase, class II